MDIHNLTDSLSLFDYGIPFRIFMKNSSKILSFSQVAISSLNEGNEASRQSDNGVLRSCRHAELEECVHFSLIFPPLVNNLPQLVLSPHCMSRRSYPRASNLSQTLQIVRDQQI